MISLTSGSRSSGSSGPWPRISSQISAVMRVRSAAVSGVSSLFSTSCSVSRTRCSSTSVERSL